MRILITNDDGINAARLIPFVRWAQKLGEVSVYAPKTEQSGKSHGIEIHKPFEIKKVELLPGVEAYSVDSTPADCVRAAILGFKNKYDLVLSGINRGYNMGGDIIYSGTCSAAREAAYLGVNAMSVSAEVDYNDGVEHMDKIWDFFSENDLFSKHCFYNVNIPPEGGKVLLTEQGGPYYTDGYDPLGGDMYIAHGRCVYEDGDDLTQDTHCVIHGFISVSPLTIKQTAYEVYRCLKNSL